MTIKFYAKNYPYRLIFKSVRLKMAENMFLASSDRPWQNNNFCLRKNISLKNVSKIINLFSQLFLPQTVPPMVLKTVNGKSFPQEERCTDNMRVSEPESKQQLSMALHRMSAFVCAASGRRTVAIRL